MNKETGQLKKPHWFRSYNDYWYGIIIMNLIYGTLNFTSKNQQLKGGIELIFSLVFTPIFNAIIALILFGISWLFKRNFTYEHYLKIFATWSFIALLVQIINLFM